MLRDELTQRMKLEKWKKTDLVLRYLVLWHLASHEGKGLNWSFASALEKWSQVCLRQLLKCRSLRGENNVLKYKTLEIDSKGSNYEKQRFVAKQFVSITPDL